jgi:type II secretory pathway pseudopilin PulG
MGLMQGGGEQHAAIREGRTGERRPAGAWTLIEIMIVVGILGIVMTMSIPAFSQLRRKADLRQAVADVVEVCSTARARAILGGRPVELWIRPQEKLFWVAGGVGDGAAAEESGAGPDPRSPLNRLEERSGLSARLPESIALEMVDVNFVEFKDAELARVRFFPNGTCDELTLVVRSERNEYRKITLEVTTALARVETLGNR